MLSELGVNGLSSKFEVTHLYTFSIGKMMSIDTNLMVNVSKTELRKATTVKLKASWRRTK